MQIHKPINGSHGCIHAWIGTVSVSGFHALTSAWSFGKTSCSRTCVNIHDGIRSFQASRTATIGSQTRTFQILHMHSLDKIFKKFLYYRNGKIVKWYRHQRAITMGAMPFHQASSGRWRKDEARQLAEIMFCVSFSALTPLVGWQEGHLVHKKLVPLIYEDFLAEQVLIFWHAPLGVPYVDISLQGCPGSLPVLWWESH